MRELQKAMGEITSARLSLGASGAAVSTREQLRFQLDHALARDAVHAELDVAALVRGWGGTALVSASAVVGGRQEYLRRPDLGRRLSSESAERLREVAASLPPQEIVFVVADGLSALAVERHAVAVLQAAREFVTGPVVVVREGRVAVGDEVGEILRAEMTVMLIGERPGLSAADSLGVYLTWGPKVGRTDAERNCISNIREGGLGYAEAAERIGFYVKMARKLQATGVALKDTGGQFGLESGGAVINS